MSQRRALVLLVLVAVVALAAGLVTGVALDRLPSSPAVSASGAYTEAPSSPAISPSETYDEGPSGQGGWVADACVLSVPGHDAIVEVADGCTTLERALRPDGFQYMTDGSIAVPAGDSLICEMAEPAGVWRAAVFDSGSAYYGAKACASLRALSGH